jgi:hypothetical protein
MGWVEMGRMGIIDGLRRQRATGSKIRFLFWMGQIFAPSFSQ